MSVGAAKIVFFYRKEIPEIINSTIALDGRMSLIKDGIKELPDGHKAVRATVVIYMKGGLGSSHESKRIKNFLKLLDGLESNNQIIGYKSCC